MDKEIIETVLTEVLSNGVEINENVKDLKRDISVCSSMIEHREIKVAPPDTSEFNELLDNWGHRILQAMETFPKKHTIRVLLFPENNTVEYLKKLWKISLMWVLFIIIALSLYRLGDKWIDKSYDVRVYKNAWDSVYNRVDRKSQKMMEEKLRRSYE